MATGEGGGRDRNPSWGEAGTQRVQGVSLVCLY